ncbi:hypothetical protein [Devosia sp. 63-57]|uniref:hypothetical protein n=1 Tax=Devosia sp. 63-57 TaxID=1895751 RepID=UPI00257DCBB2|nr:hypothetical protein [Devosia sp. 63-57]
MGKLLQLTGRARPATTGNKPPGDAQILIFTGVRYERGTTPPPNNRLDPSRPKRKRG